MKKVLIGRCGCFSDENELEYYVENSAIFPINTHLKLAEYQQKGDSLQAALV
ncbi:hypothetical protein ACFFH2_09140 [Enterococcus devriesei]|uniref:Uncharacterized protein n=1 Tax=Enterococcus devriesei TaxID=319970 RepID=A0A1L8STG5_9ENTE|nr:hypothetical protein [Enterococcus devriesei]MDU6524307.1 hypothetical protein [Enterococcus sp.]OJG35409.1 hypothetical protein RV00_GL002594 [Enterococcus devriesei]